MINLKEHLTGGRFVSHNDIKPRARSQYDGIMKNKTAADPRTPEQVWKQTYSSIACEIGIARSLPNGKVNDQKFDHTNVHSYGWDVSGLTNVLFEIKHEHLTEDWYSFKEFTAEKIMSRFKSKAYHYLITASTKEADDGLEIWPRLLIDPSTFRHYIYKTNYATGKKPLWYNHISAYRSEDCDIFNTDIVKKMQKSEKNGVHLQKSVVE